jgi:ComF family protein
METINKIKEYLLDLFFPKICLSCGQEGKYICDNCSVFLSEAPSFLTAEGLEVFSMWYLQGHKDPLARVIRRIRAEGIDDAVFEVVKLAFQEMFRDRERFESLFSFALDKETQIAYIPLHFNKKNELQLVVAQAFGKMIDKKPVSLLKRVKETVPQEKLPKEQRIKNIEKAFQFESSFIPKKVLLIDDIWASGATMKECFKILKEAGVEKVVGFTLGKIS